MRSGGFNGVGGDGVLGRLREGLKGENWKGKRGVVIWGGGLAGRLAFGLLNGLRHL